jgi:hypothetical protein
MPNPTTPPTAAEQIAAEIVSMPSHTRLDFAYAISDRREGSIENHLKALGITAHAATEEAEALREAIRQIVTQRGDNICWRDVYTDLAKLVGVDFCPQLIADPEKMLVNCRAFVQSLQSGPYVPVYVENAEASQAQNRELREVLGELVKSIKESTDYPEYDKAFRDAKSLLESQPPPVEAGKGMEVRDAVKHITDIQLENITLREKLATVAQEAIERVSGHTASKVAGVRAELVRRRDLNGVGYVSSHDRAFVSALNDAISLLDKAFGGQAEVKP